MTTMQFKPNKIGVGEGAQQSVIQYNWGVTVVLACSVCMLFETTQHYNILIQITYLDADVNMKTNISNFAWFPKPYIVQVEVDLRKTYIQDLSQIYNFWLGSH